MRQIGTLPRNLDPQVFGDHLLSQGMKARIDDRPEGWQVWIYNEDQFDPRQSRSWRPTSAIPTTLASQQAGKAADRVRQEEAKLDREYRKNFREVTDQWSGLRLRRRPADHGSGDRLGGVFVLQQSPPVRQIVRTRF